MSYWSNNPELYDEIITNALPEPWHTRVIEGEIDLTDVPGDIFQKAAIEGEREYWSGLADQVKAQKKYDMKGAD